MAARKMTTLQLQRAKRAADAVARDNPIDTGQSVDDIEISAPAVPRRPARTKTARAAAAPAPSRVKRPPPKAARRQAARRPQPRANPQVRQEVDETIPMRALGTKAGLGGRRVDPTAERQPMRDPQTGRVVIIRDGITYTRRHTNVGDKFHIANEDIPDGMSYQWIAVSVLGLNQRNSIQNFVGNGWREVHTDRYPGRYAPPKVREHIIIDGLGLYERPIELTLEARAEEVKAAKDLIRTRNDQFVPKLPEARARRGTELRAKRSIEGMPDDIGRPSYQMDVDDGLL